MQSGEMERVITTVQLVYAALAGSAAMYVVIPWLVARQGGLAPKDVPGGMLLALAALGVAGLLAGPVLTRLLLRQAAPRPDGSVPPGAAAAVQTAYVVGAAVVESAAVVGLVLTFLTGRMLWVAGFAAAAALSLVASWPRRSRIEAFLGGPTTPLEP